MSLCLFISGENTFGRHMKNGMNPVDSHSKGEGKILDYSEMIGKRSVPTCYHEVYTAQTQCYFHRVTSYAR